MTRGALMETSDNPELAKAFVELGQPLAGYSQSFRTGFLVAGTAALITVLLYVLLVNVTLPPFLFVTGILVITVGLAGVLWGLTLVWHELRSSSYRICPGGLVVFQRNRVESVRWSEVTSAEFTRTQNIWAAGLWRGRGTFRRDSRAGMDRAWS